MRNTPRASHPLLSKASADLSSFSPSCRNDHLPTQYVLIEEKGRPIFFLSWAWMSEEAERRYLTQETVVLPEEDWCNGDRMWFRDFIAPFGHAEALFRLVREEIFPHHVARFLWHRGNEKGRRIKTFYGRQVTREALLNWKHTHPLHGQK